MQVHPVLLAVADAVTFVALAFIVVAFVVWLVLPFFQSR